MKFGETLRERSAPQWAIQNIDYDDLKRIIKDRTTSSQNQPRFIPGQGNEAKALKDFEKELYDQLLEQHERVSRFVRSKGDELARRLVDLEKRVEALSQRVTFSKNSRLSMRCIERLSRLEDETLDTGREVGDLDRFVVVNHQGLNKLLKKYKKWTGSADLEKRFQEHVLERRIGFTNSNLLPSLALYNKVLADIRLASSSRSKSVKTRDSPGEAEESTSNQAADLKNAFEHGSDAEMDTAFAVLPLGLAATTASFWIHPENLLQLQVLLLRHARSRKNQISISTPSQLSSRLSRRGSLSESGSFAAVQSGDGACLIVCDDLPTFARRQNSITVDDSAKTVGRSLDNSATSIRLSSTGKAVVVVGTPQKGMSNNDRDHGQSGFRTTEVKRKALRRLFDARASIEEITSPEEQDSRSQNLQLSESGDSPLSTCLNITTNVKIIEQWLGEHQEVQPLLELKSQRCRFTGIYNTADSGLWATLDTDVTMAKSTLMSLDKYDSSESSNDADSAIHRFPYAILSIRIEGNARTSLVKELDGSHLAERVHGFSLETHAIATLYQPRNMSTPSWFSLLNGDIRKAPRAIESCHQRDARSTPPSGSTRPTSASTASGGAFNNYDSSPRFQSSETSAPDIAESSSTLVRQKRKARKERPLNKEVYESSPQQNQRYWNEFDDGEENSDHEPYAVYIDPNASVFPGASIVSRFSNSIMSATQKLKWRAWREKSTADERESLLGNERPTSRSSTDSSDLENGRPRPSFLPYDRHRRSPTVFERTLPRDNPHDIWVTRAAIVSFIISFVLLFLVGVLVITGRRKAVAETDVGALVGAAFSLALGVGGLLGLVLRKRRANWLSLTIAGLLFTGIVAGNSVLLVRVL